MIHQSLIYQNKFGTPGMRALWTEEQMLQGWLDLEAAVTAAQGDMGAIPKSVADKIVRNCNTKKITPQAVAAWHKKTGHVIVSLVKSFRDAVPDAGEQFHLGLTTQDVLDTGLTLQIRNALRLLIPALFELEDTLLKLAHKHRTTVMAGRSEGQQGAPITFGYKVAVMADTISAHLDRLEACAERLMILTLFGATGVQSSYALVVGKKNVGRLTRLVGKRLGLVVPLICPHKRIDRFAELGQILAMICTTLGEMGMEIRDLQRNEVSEVAEPWGDAQFSSSTMPQKQNPEPSEWLTGLARLARGFSSSLTEIQTQHERDISRVAPEFYGIPNLFLHTAVAVESATRIFGGLQVYKARMWDNLMEHGGLIMAESVMLGLAEKSKRKVWAHQLVHDIAIKIAAKGGNFGESITRHKDIKKYLSPADVQALLKPENYIGTAAEQVAAVRDQARKRRDWLKKRFRKTLGSLSGT